MHVLLLFVAALFLAGQLNRATYRLAWNPRPIGPWSAPHPHAPPRHWSDRLPVIGWLGLERESFLHGPWFWLRPMLVELLFAMGIVWLYQFETSGGLHPGQKLTSSLLTQIHWQFLSHWILLSLMLVATLIDLDEQVIPDSITLPGTMIGLALATARPMSLLPAHGDTLWATAPNPWSPQLDGSFGLALVWLGLGLWCLSLLPRTIYFRRGFFKGIQFLAARMLRGPDAQRMGGLALLLALFSLIVWSLGGDAWRGLLTGVAGLTLGGALVWAIRVAASISLQKEALGFGDVTLMGMIGTFLGWQSAMLIFFMAPFAGVIMALVQFAASRRPDIAYGPYLCLAATVAIVIWPTLWERWGFAFGLGWILPAILLVCIALMALMLLGYRKLTAG